MHGLAAAAAAPAIAHQMMALESQEDVSIHGLADLVKMDRSFSFSFDHGTAYTYALLPLKSPEEVEQSGGRRQALACNPSAR